jgi:hypothetical protein
MDVSGQFHAFTLHSWGKNSGMHFIGGWVSPTAGLMKTKKSLLLPGIELESLYMLSVKWHVKKGQNYLFREKETDELRQK